MLVVQLMELLHRLRNNIYSCVQLILVYHQSWGKSHAVIVSRLRQQSVLHQDLSEVVSINRQVMVEFKTTEQASTPNFFNKGAIKSCKFVV